MGEEVIRSDFERGLKGAGENVERLKEIQRKCLELFTDRLLIATGNKPDIAEDLLKDVANIAGHAAAVAVGQLRLDLEESKIDPKLYRPPHEMPPKQESLFFSSEGIDEITDGLRRGLVKDRSKIVAEGESPVQKKTKARIKFEEEMRRQANLKL